MAQRPSSQIVSASFASTQPVPRRKTDAESTSRGKRVLGMVLSRLTQQPTQHAGRQAVEERLACRLEEEKRRVAEEVERETEERRRRIEEERIAEERHESGRLERRWEEQRINLSTHLQTESEPKLYWRPIMMDDDFDVSRMLP